MVTATLDVYWFDASELLQNKKQSDARQNNTQARKQKYCCALCGNEITSQDQAVEIDGSHQHAKTNPDGRRFLVRCFSSAKGCDKQGEATTYHTWFTGYTWQFAHCLRCRSQLGWYFKGHGFFYGLIGGQLVRCDE